MKFQFKKRELICLALALILQFALLSSSFAQNPATLAFENEFVTGVFTEPAQQVDFTINLNNSPPASGFAHRASTRQVSRDAEFAELIFYANENIISLCVLGVFAVDFFRPS